MKLIEAMKRIKTNKDKMGDLQLKIQQNCARLSHETPLYGEETAGKIKEWAQSAEDIGQENIRLLICIQRTNLATPVTIELGGKKVTKNVAEWVWRRREYSQYDMATWGKMTDGNRKEGTASSSTPVPTEVKIIRYYDPIERDKKLQMYQSEPREIDAALEVINATTDLIE